MKRIKKGWQIIMKYDFTSIIDREGKDAIAVEVIPFKEGVIKEGFTKIPMWVADMNYATVPTIQEAIIERAKHPTFGYFFPREEYYNSIIEWHRKRNGVNGVKKENIGYENGVLGCLTSALQAFTAPGEAVLLHSPTYIGFTGTIENNGRKIILSDLILDADGIWRMDYDDMDKKIKENKIHFCVFCSPHNPAGRVWEKEEIEKAMEIYKKNDCIVISDEIWSDLILEGHKHIPTQSVSEDAKNRTIAIYAPSKTFNLAGLIGSYHIIYSKYLKDRVDKQSSLSHYNNINLLSMYALIGAYKPEGYEWVDELNQVLTKNINYSYDYIHNNFKGVKMAKPQGTYMIYIDCEEWCKNHDVTMDELIKKGISVGVVWQDGRPFHRPYSIRMNLAVPYSLVVEAFDRLDQYVFNE